MLAAVFALFTALNVSAVDTSSGGYVYSAEELMAIAKTNNTITAELKEEDGQKFIHVTATEAVDKDKTGSYIIFNFFPDNLPEKDFVPEFSVKEYPVFAIGYRTNALTTNNNMALNASMKIDDTYCRCWGMMMPIKTNSEFTQGTFSLSNFQGSFEGKSGWGNVPADSGVKYIRLPLWAYLKDASLVPEDYYDIEYIGFFKTVEDANAYDPYDVKENVQRTVTYVDENGNTLRTATYPNGTRLPLPTAPVKKGVVFVGWVNNKGDIIKDGYSLKSDLTLTAKYEKDPNAENEIVDSTPFYGFTATDIDNEGGFQLYGFEKQPSVVEEDGHVYVRFTTPGGLTASGEKFIIFANFTTEFKVKDYPYIAVAYKSNIDSATNAVASVNIKAYGKYTRFWGLKDTFKGNDKPQKLIMSIADITGGDGVSSISYDFIDYDSTIKYVRFSPWEGWEKGTTVDGQYLDLEYIAFFKTKEEAEEYEYSVESFDQTAADTHAPFIAGYDGRLFKPDNNMTRAEACTVITRLLVDENTLDNSKSTAFTDLNKDAWYYKYITYLEELGYLKAYNGDFKPDQKITRAEFVDLVYQTGKIAGGDKNVSFKDVPATHSRYNAIMAAAKAGIVNGKTADTFDPDGDIKRSEVVKVLCLALGRTPSMLAMENVSALGFNDVFDDHWAYIYVMEAATEHGIQFAGTGDEIWVKVIDDTEFLKPLPNGLVEQFNEEFAKKVEAVRNSESQWETAQRGRVYYVSSSEGDDSNRGLDINAPIKTLAEVAKRQTEAYIGQGRILAGDVVLFKRGDEWHEHLSTAGGIQYSAYGEGPKPRILGSVEADNAAQWIETDVEHVYKFIDPLTNKQDVGNIVFNEGYCYGQRIVKQATLDQALAVGRENIASNGLAQWKFIPGDHKFAGYADLKAIADKIPEADLMYYHDREGYALYLYCEKGNPGDVFDSIDLCVKGHGVSAANNVTLDNLFIGYAGSHGVSAGSVNNLIVRNCEIGWIGGSVQGEDVKVRFGNAVEIYGVGKNFQVYDNFIYQCFDCGPTIQVTLAESSTVKKAEFRDVSFYNNALWEASLEIWFGSTRINTEDYYAKLINVTMHDNFVTMSGFGWKGYNHTSNREYTSFYGGGATNAEFIDCYAYNNKFWNVRWQIIRCVPNSMKNGLGFQWYDNVFIHREGAPFGRLAQNPKTADGADIYYLYTNENIRRLIADRAIGDNEFYTIPAFNKDTEIAPSVPQLPTPDIDVPFNHFPEPIQ